MIILLVLYGIIAIRYVTTKEENRETNLRFRRPQPPRPLPPPQPPIMRPQQIEAVLVKDVVVEVELCCPICLEDLKEDGNDYDDGKVMVCLSKCKHSFHMSCIFAWLRQTQDCPICRSPVYCGEVTLIK